MKIKELPAEEILETWENDRDGEYITLGDKIAYYCAHGRVMEEIYPKYGNIWGGIRVWMDANGYYPNIWQANDHGNLSLYDNRGNYLGGLV